MLLREFIMLFLESKNDVKELIGINVRQLKKQRPGESPKVLQQLAQDGPVFSAETVAFIAGLTDGEVFVEDRKRYVKWLATILETTLSTEAADEHAFIRADAKNRAIEIADWARAHPDDYLSFKEFYSALYEVEGWHDIKADDSISIESDDIEQIWPDGWKIVRVSAEDCDAEGKAMGHCVGTYSDKVTSGASVIFSLRDPNDKPHVTIEVKGDTVTQIKGKQNRPPETPLYRRKVIEWLKSTEYSYVHGDYLSLLDAKELKELLSNHDDVIDFSRTVASGVLKDITSDDITQYIDRIYDQGADAETIADIMYYNPNIKIIHAFKNSKFPELRIPAITSGINDVLLELASDVSPEVRLALAQWVVGRVEREGEFSNVIEKLMIDDDEKVAKTAIPRPVYINEMPSAGTVTITKVHAQKQKSKYGFVHYQISKGNNIKHTLDLVARDKHHNVFVKEDGIPGIIDQHTIEQGQVSKPTKQIYELPLIKWKADLYY